MKLLSNYLYNVSFQLLNVLIPFVTLPYVSRVLGVDNMGINAYTNSIIIYFVLIANFGTSLYGSRTIAYNRDNIYKRTQVFCEILTIKFIMALISFLLLLGFTSVCHSYSYIIYLQAIHIIAAAFDISWLYTGLEDFKKIAIRNFFVKLFSCFLMFLLVTNEDDLENYIVILSASSLLGNLLFWLYIKNYLVKIRLSTIRVYSHIVPIIILFMPQISISIFTTVNRIFLGNFSSLSQVGYFDVADKLIRIVLPIIVAIGGVFFPRIANNFNNGYYDKVNKLTQIAFRLTFLLSVPIAFGLVCISDIFSNLLFGEKFHGISTVISILSIALIFMSGASIIGNQYLVAINQPKYLTVSLTIATAVLILFSILLTPLHGAIGAALAALIGEATAFLVLLFCVSKYFKLKFLFVDFFKILLSGLVMVMVCLSARGLFSVSEYADFINLFTQIILGVLSYTFCLFLLKTDIANLIKNEVYNKFRALNK
ncbi:hypothetical protein BKG94_01660 [Rodentibacter ratti]|uniref:oligosaccharide flippase family protein n=1 Tax=Rodentibacter ratti TaxID=1906745 RepID=UPI00098562A9|nr:oligosaccharide flippase family protein [Rodentibacter ratti]OOF89328.1 hypothetical protein BKG94_01660 [Rodentibacter ratti]